MVEMTRDQFDIILIHPPFHRRSGSGSVPPLGLLSLSSALRHEGFSSKIIDCALIFNSQTSDSLVEMRQWLSAILEEAGPRLVIGLGPCTTSTIRAARAVAQTCRDIFPDVPLVCGGPLTLIPGIEWVIFEYIEATAMVRGDGEFAMPRIARRLRLGRSLSGIPGVQTTAKEIVLPTFLEHLDSLPLPDWGQVELGQYFPSVRRDLFAYPAAPLVGSRGCALNCGFCLSGTLLKYRRHSLEYTAGHAALLTKHHGVKSLIFYDDCLFPPNSDCTKDLRTFGRLMHRSSAGAIWQMEIVPMTLQRLDSLTVKQLFNSGCRQLNIGVEKSSENTLEAIGKKYSVEDLRDSCNLIKDAAPKMRLTASFILGGPGETRESVHHTIALAQELPLLYAHFYPLFLYPGTPLYNSAVGDHGKLWFKTVTLESSLWGELVYQERELSGDQLVDLVQYAYSSFYGSTGWKEIARSELGNHFERVDRSVKRWTQDRFRLNKS